MCASQKQAYLSLSLLFCSILISFSHSLTHSIYLFFSSLFKTHTQSLTHFISPCLSLSLLTTISLSLSFARQQQSHFFYLSISLSVTSQTNSSYFEKKFTAAATNIIERSQQGSLVPFTFFFTTVQTFIYFFCLFSLLLYFLACSFLSFFSNY